MTAIAQIVCEFRFESAHWLPDVEPGHKCNRVHGHSYRLSVTVEGPIGTNGFVVDFAEVKSAVNPLIKQLDHYMLNDVVKNPTAENMLVWFWEELWKTLPGVVELRLWETESNSAVYRGERL